MMILFSVWAEKVGQTIGKSNNLKPAQFFQDFFFTTLTGGGTLAFVVAGRTGAAGLGADEAVVVVVVVEVVGLGVGAGSGTAGTIL
jgi:hypothetical protein